jgi:hypothetical protein
MFEQNCVATCNAGIDALFDALTYHGAVDSGMNFRESGGQIPELGSGGRNLFAALQWLRAAQLQSDA